MNILFFIIIFAPVKMSISLTHYDNAKLEHFSVITKYFTEFFSVNYVKVFKWLIFK